MQSFDVVWRFFRRPLFAMRTITLCFHKANRTYALATLAAIVRMKPHGLYAIQRPSEKYSDGLFIISAT